jgi:NADPH2:quinone reductase
MGHVLGARVIAVAGSPSKAAACRALGADCFIDSSNEDVVARVQQETDGQGADVIFDPVGGAAFEEARHYVAVDGRILVVGFASGEIPVVRVNSVLYRSYSVMGVYVGAYKRDADRAYLKRVYGELDELMTEGRLRPLIARRITLEQVPAALEDLAARRVVGKVVVHPDGLSH